MSNAQKVSAERLAGMLTDLRNHGGSTLATIYVEPYVSALTELQSLRAAPTPDAHSEVGVKALEWVEDEIGWWSAQPDAMFRGYELRITDRGAVRVRRGNEDRFTFDGTADEAKAHWQADFAQRVQSCLTAGVVKAEPVAWRWSFDAGENWNYGPRAPGKFRFGDPDLVEPLYAALASKPDVKAEPVAWPNPKAATSDHEAISARRAFEQWRASLKRPDLSEEDRVKGVIEAYQRQAFALASKPEGEL